MHASTTGRMHVPASSCCFFSRGAEGGNPCLDAKVRATHALHSTGSMFRLAQKHTYESDFLGNGKLPFVVKALLLSAPFNPCSWQEVSSGEGQQCTLYAALGIDS